MEWIKLQLHVIRSEEYIGCEPVQRAAYIGLLAYCVDQENSGIIKDCKSWNDRKWMQLCGVMKDEVINCSLFWFENDDLHVYAYTMDEQKLVENKREKGRIAANKRWKNRSPNTDSNTDSNTDGNTDGNTDKIRLDKTRLDESIQDTAHSIDDSEDPFNNQPSKAKEITDSDWHCIKFEKWCTTLKRLGAKIGPNNWTTWSKLIDDHGNIAVEKATGSIDATKRWPDDVEIQIFAQKKSMSIDEERGDDENVIF